MSSAANNIWPSWLPIRADIADLSPYGAPQISDLVALNTNENPFELPEVVISQMLQDLPGVLANLNRYPDRDAQALRGALVAYINKKSNLKLDLNNIWAANGSNEILQTIMLACGGVGALGFVPSYSVHSLIAKTTGTNWSSAARNSDFELGVDGAIAAITETKPGLTFITTPNNPTGTATPLADVAKLAAAALEVNGILIVDEAYQEFSDELSAVTLLKEFPNIVVVRTMSKAFALAGARIGYCLADPMVISALKITRLPYHLSSTTQALGLIALANSDLLLAEVGALITERNRVAGELAKLGFAVIPSSANFLLFSGFSGASAEAWNDFIKRGILIRDVGLLGYLRVTIGKVGENNQFLAAAAELRQ